MDPATIGLLISIAPTVLDLLFGRGSDFQSRSKNSALQARSKNNIIKHETLLENPEEMYGYGLEGYGYRYPRRRQITVETYYPESVQPEFVRTAVFNRAVAAKNPWLEFLHRNEYFKKISDTLKEAAKKYRETHPITENFRKALRRQYPKLQAEKNILQKELQNKRLAQEFATNFPGADYINTIQGKIDKLQNELDRIKPFIETGQLQPTLP